MAVLLHSSTASSSRLLRWGRRLTKTGWYRPDLTDWLGSGSAVSSVSRQTTGWLIQDGRREKPHRHQISDTGNKMIKNLTGWLTVPNLSVWNNWRIKEMWLLIGWSLMAVSKTQCAKTRRDTEQTGIWNSLKPFIQPCMFFSSRAEQLQSYLIAEQQNLLILAFEQLFWCIWVQMPCSRAPK